MIAVKTSYRRLIKLVGSVNGAKATCIIDTGASCSVISNNFVRKHNVPLSDSTTNINMADGSSTNAQQTERLILSLANRTCELSFLATNLNAGDILIGLDWLTQHNVWIHPTKRLLVFNIESNIETYTESDSLLNQETLMTNSIDDEMIDELEWHE